MSSFVNRMIAAGKLDTSVYEEVEADSNALGQAMGVVVLSSIAAGIGTFTRDAGIGIVIAGVLSALLGWYIWALLTWWIGTKFLAEPQTNATIGQLLRTTGFSSSPGLIRVLGFIPGLNLIVFLAASIWMLIAMVIAVRQALDYSSTGRAIGVCVIGWLAQLVIIGAVYATLGLATM